MKNAKLGRYGFTLVELLVVVLIIGILASVALPQYNKAVRKARLSEVATTFSSISKGIDTWLLENGGYPPSSVYFSGNGTGSSYAKLDIQQSCAKEETGSCYTKVGQWTYYCHDGSNCHIELQTNYNADGTTGSKWLDGKHLCFVKQGDNQWSLDTGHGDVNKDICKWWKGMHGNKSVTGGYGASISTACDAY